MKRRVIEIEIEYESVLGEPDWGVAICFITTAVSFAIYKLFT